MDVAQSRGIILLESIWLKYFKEFGTGGLETYEVLNEAREPAHQFQSQPPDSGRTHHVLKLGEINEKI